MCHWMCLMIPRQVSSLDEYPGWSFELEKVTEEHLNIFFYLSFTKTDLPIFLNCWSLGLRLYMLAKQANLIHQVSY